MNSLLAFREKLRSFYADYDVYIRPVLKFAVAVICFLAINNSIGYLNVLNNLFVILILSVICAILPLNGIVVISVILIVAHSFGLSLETGVFALILYLLMTLVYFRFVPRDALALILTPAAFYFHVPALVPVSLGLIRGPLSAVTAMFGVISWEYMHSLPETIAPLLADKETSALDVIQAMPQALISREAILRLIVFVVVTLIVAAIRKLVSTHPWEIGIITGSVIYAVLMVAGSLIFGAKINLVTELIGTVVAALVAFVLEFFYYSADYAGSEYLQFEDDNSYYYVRIVPKRKPVYAEEEEQPADPDDTGIPEDDSTFVVREEPTEMEKKFEGINLQSRLEESLKTLNTNQSGRENTESEPRRAGRPQHAGRNSAADADDGTASADSLGDTKTLNSLFTGQAGRETGEKTGAPSEDTDHFGDTKILR